MERNPAHSFIRYGGVLKNKFSVVIKRMKTASLRGNLIILKIFEKISQNLSLILKIRIQEKINIGLFINILSVVC
jgi:hypothetical protein